MNIDKKAYKFLIILYYGENHITIFKSCNIGVCYEVIQIFYGYIENPLKIIDFVCGKNNEISVMYFDTIGNLFRKRFLVVNFPVKIKLNKINLNKMEENSSYKITLLPNDIIVQENKKFAYEKIKITNFNNLNKIYVEIDDVIKDKDLTKFSKIKNELIPYEKYFNQNLMNKGNDDWNSEELTAFFYYCKFKLFLNYSCVDENNQIFYYIASNGNI